jgi:hypothetical protein
MMQGILLSRVQQRMRRCASLAVGMGLVLGLVQPVVVQAQAADAPAAASAAAVPVPTSLSFPDVRELDGYRLTIYAPQIRSWPEFESFEAVMAVELAPSDGAPNRYATVTVRGDTEVDVGRRVVLVSNPQVEMVRFAGGEAPPDYTARIEGATRSGIQEIPLELFIAHLAEEVLSAPPPEGFSKEPPVILVTGEPTLLLFVNGEAVLTEVPGAGLDVVVNASWPLFREREGAQRYYLLDNGEWLTSDALERGWAPTQALPEGFSKLPDEPQFAAARAAVPAAAPSEPTPRVVYANRPTELIVTEGAPRTEAVPETGGLEYVVNTESPLFRLAGRWYYLVAGRWFSTGDLQAGPWQFVEELPEDFAQIPVDHPLAEVRASVPGTPEARMAVVEASIPVKVSAAPGAAPPIEVQYAGEPRFETIQGTGVSRAANVGYDVLEYDGRYYLLYAGLWYEAAAPTGPWAVTGNVPGAIYTIPPSSPAYHVTQVTVVESTPTTVVYSYPPSYSSGIYVAYGVPYYGTGWYYPPYYYGGIYYPYWGSYGHGSWYNPVTGGYGSRSVWYGPYGGYSYTQGYNPSTGRYGYVETAWDKNEWASSGGTYNPRTGVGTQTDRYYNEKKNTAEMERTTTRGDQWVQTERNVDFNEGTANIKRETSGGGSSQVQRERTAGGITSEGTVTTGDGRQYDVSGVQGRGGGTTTITGEGGSMNIDTRRQGGSSISTIEGSGGGQGISVSGEGPGRTTIGQSGSGDIYAGHDGNVFKKTDDGWQQYNNGEWQQVDRPGAGPRADGQGAGSRDLGGRSASDYGYGERRDQAAQRGSYADIERDHRARQQATQQRTQRAGGYQRGSFGGGMRGGMGGGRRR